MKQEDALELSYNPQRPLLSRRETYNYEASVPVFKSNDQRHMSTIRTPMYLKNPQTMTNRLESSDNPTVNQEDDTVLKQIYSDCKLRQSQRALKGKSETRRIIKQYLSRIPALKPNSAWLVFWHVYISLLVIGYFFEIPIYITFGNSFWTDIMPIWVIRFCLALSLVSFLADMIIEFITAYYLHGNLVTKKSKIATNYLQGNFTYDVIAVQIKTQQITTLTLRLGIPSDTYRWFYFFFYFRLPSLMKTFKEFEEMVLLNRRIRTAFSITQILLALFFSFVAYGCGFILLGKWAIGRDHHSWLLNNGNFGVIMYMDQQSQFFFSFYYALGTLSSTMGYGDVKTPLNIYECSYALLGIVFSVMIFAITMSFMFKILEEYNMNSLKMFRTRITINRFMKDKNVPRDVSERVRQYLNEHWFEQGTRDFDLEKATISTLAPQLREELLFSSYGKFLQSVPMFSENFSRPFLKALSLRIQEISFSQGETIFKDRNSELTDDNQFYFIYEGSVLIYPQLGSKLPENVYLNKLRNGQWFGEWGFLTGMNRKASAVAHSYTCLYVISRDDFLDCIQRFPEDYEEYCMMRDRLLLENDLTVIGEQCWTCGGSDHYSTNCTLSHFCPSTQKVVSLEGTQYANQQRTPFVRAKVKRWHTTKNQSKLVKLTQRNRFQGLVNFLKQKQRIIKKKEDKRNEMELTIPPTQSQFPIQDQIMEESAQINMSLVNRKEQLELQRQFAAGSSMKIQTGLTDFDNPHQFKHYRPEENVSRYWTQNGILRKR